jgi:cytoskeletal protein CcmA (bactofilin family)
VSKQDKATLSCPQCGQQQLVARTAFSAVCKQCGLYLRVQDLLAPAPKVAKAAPEQKRIACFDCQAEFDVPAGAQSTMCKRCSTYIDLHNYDIANAVSRNFRTKGSFVIQPAGYVFNTEAVVADAVIKGRFIGKLVAERTLTIYSSAEIKGTLTAARLIIPASNVFRWNGELTVDTAEIEGELIANLTARFSILVKSRGRLFGAVKTRSLTAEQGGVLVGAARIGGEA